MVNAARVNCHPCPVGQATYALLVGVQGLLARVLAAVGAARPACAGVGVVWGWMEQTTVRLGIGWAAFGALGAVRHFGGLRVVPGLARLE